MSAGGIWNTSSSTAGTIMFASTSISSVIGSWAPVCSGVSLSTKTGARCGCGKFTMTAEALQIKAQPFGELRQVVAGGFKLAHGAALGSITWAQEPVKR